MLLALMYHRVGKEKHANTLEMLDAHFAYLKKHYPVLLPGDPLAKRKLSLCLTFDDATFDFYHSVFPLLKKHQLRALVGVPASYILPTTTTDPQERLAVPYTMAMQDGFWDVKAPFCTWEELQEMVSSGLVEVASHSYLHCNLTFDFVDLHREIVLSKEVIEKNLPQAVSSFIYPFGKMNMRVHEQVAEHYPYSFRIGSALNFGWGSNKKPLSRVIADNMPSEAALFTPTKKLSYLLKSLLT